MRVSHETIYRSLFVQARGVLKKELQYHLRTQRKMRHSRVNFNAKLTQVFHSNLTRLFNGFRGLCLLVSEPPRCSWQSRPSCF
jgi:hypothetical protein